MKKYQDFYLKTFSFGGEIFNVFEKACFRIRNLTTPARPAPGSVTFQRR